jgi:cobalt-zinc-cadmium efflux system protein
MAIHHHHHDHGCNHDHGHKHGHGHGHSHGHHHAHASHDEAFAVGIVLNIAYVFACVFYGFASHSLSLIADAGHNLGDVLGLLLAWMGSWLSRRPPSRTRTYGLGRSSILASLVNAVMLLVATGGIAWTAATRLFTPVHIDTHIVMKVAAVGILINTGTALMFLRGSDKDINIRGAFLHMAFDAGLSLGVLISAFAIRHTGWQWLDPAVSLVIVAVVASECFRMLREAVNLTLDAVPAGIDRGGVEEFLKGLPGVIGVHDLHIWPISTTSVALTAHLVQPEGHADDAWLFAAGVTLNEKFGIDHPTLQVERGTDPHACKLAPDEVV